MSRRLAAAGGVGGGGVAQFKLILLPYLKFFYRIVYNHLSVTNYVPDQIFERRRKMLDITIKKNCEY